MTTQTTHHRTSTMICHHIYDLELLFLLLITRIPHPMLIYFLYYIKYQHILPRRETRITHMINIYTVDGIVQPQKANQTKRPAPTTHHNRSQTPVKNDSSITPSFIWNSLFTVDT